MAFSPASKTIPYRNILIIKPGAVGDLLQMTPVIRALKQASPAARITLLVGLESSASLFRHHPDITEVLVFDRTGAQRSRASLFSFLGRVRKARYDLVLNFQRSNLRTWFIVAASLPARVLVYHKARGRVVHVVENYLETLAPLSLPPAGTELEFHPGKEAGDFARELLARHGLSGHPLVALNPGATHAVNRWPLRRFAELADLVAERTQARPVIIGGPDDRDLADEIVARSRSKPVSLAGATSLLQLGAVLRSCAVVVSGDTGPLHMATAVGTKVVALFGAADPGRTGPVGSHTRTIRAQGVACVPCRSRACSNTVSLECMERITAEEVLAAVIALLPARAEPTV